MRRASRPGSLSSRNGRDKIDRTCLNIDIRIAGTHRIPVPAGVAGVAEVAEVARVAEFAKVAEVAWGA